MKLILIVSILSILLLLFTNCTLNQNSIDGPSPDISVNDSSLSDPSEINEISDDNLLRFDDFPDLKLKEWQFQLEVAPDEQAHFSFIIPTYWNNESSDKTTARIAPINDQSAPEWEGGIWISYEKDISANFSFEEILYSDAVYRGEALINDRLYDFAISPWDSYTNGWTWEKDLHQYSYYFIENNKLFCVRFNTQGSNNQQHMLLQHHILESLKILPA